MSWRTRARANVEEKSWGAKEENSGPGRITLPPPRSSPDEGGVRRVPRLPGRAHPPAGRGQGAGVDRRDGGREELHPFQEEGTLLRVEDGESLVGGDPGDVRLHLGEVGVQRQIQGVVGVGDPLRVHAAGPVHVAAVEGTPRSRDRLRLLPGGHVGSDDEVVPRGQPLEARQRVLVADEAGAPPGKRRREDLVAVVPRVVPEEQDAPGPGAGAVVPERGERDAHLQDPSVPGDPSRGVPVEVRRGVLAPGRIVLDGVVLDAARRREEQDPGAPVVAGVEDDPAVVDALRDVVPVGVRGPDARRVGIGELEPRVKVPVVVGEVADASDLGSHILAGPRLVPGVHAGGTSPPGVGQVSVHGDRCGGPADADLRSPFGLFGEGEGGRPEGEAGQQGEEKARAPVFHPHSYVAEDSRFQGIRDRSAPSRQESSDLPPSFPTKSDESPGRISRSAAPPFRRKSLSRQSLRDVVRGMARPLLN